MFEPISDTLNQCGCFFLTGFIFGLIYEGLRFLRLLIRHNAVVLAIEDVLFFSVFAFVCFTISLVIGSGYFRLYYAVCAFFGGIAYFFTLGKLLQFIFKRIIGSIKRFLRFVFGKIRKILGRIFGAIKHKIEPVFVKCNKNIGTIVENAKKRLPKKRLILYNNKENSEVKKEGVYANVIKAQVRKKA